MKSGGTSRSHGIASLPSGPRTKYLVLAFWLAVVMVTGGRAGQLPGAAKNGASGYSAAGQTTVFDGIDATLLFATLAVIGVLLLLTYRSPVLWLLPIVSAGAALTVAEVVSYLLTEQAGLAVDGEGGGILVVLVLGTGANYALLLVARYREELRWQADRHEAMAVALRRAGPAIAASAVTVTVGMLFLLVFDSAAISGLGPVVAISVGTALLAMITLLPALLVSCGRWVFWPVRPGPGSAEPAAADSRTRAERLAAPPTGCGVTTTPVSVTMLR